MSERYEYDAIVVGAGPNGLAAAITLAREGFHVQVREARNTIGGGTRSAELTLPGFVHDICSAIHPLAIGSPFLRSLPLDEFGLQWIQPEAPVAHPFDDGSAALLERDIRQTGETLGADAQAYRELMQPLVRKWERVIREVLAPPRPPRYPFALGRFGLRAMRSARGLAESRFEGQRARALLAGIAGHSMLPLEQPLTAGFGLLLGMMGHSVGWPMPRGGAQSIADALGRYLRFKGGEILTGAPVASIDELPSARAIFFDVTPRQLVQIAGERLPDSYRRKLERYRYGPAAFKVDWALHDPIPWTAEACKRAGTLHIGGTLEEIAASEQAVWEGIPSDKPLVLVVQHSLFDPSRAPDRKHTAWAYCHVPNGSKVDMTEHIEAQIERFAPGFRDAIMAQHVTSPLAFEQYNANYVGGDINGGIQDFRQHFARPVLSAVPYSTPLKGIYLCSSSTPPGGGVHGMCGYFAARAAVRRGL